MGYIPSIDVELRKHAFERFDERHIFGIISSERPYEFCLKYLNSQSGYLVGPPLSTEHRGEERWRLYHPRLVDEERMPMSFPLVRNREHPDSYSAPSFVPAKGEVPDNAFEADVTWHPHNSAHLAMEMNGGHPVELSERPEEVARKVA